MTNDAIKAPLKNYILFLYHNTLSTSLMFLFKDNFFTINLFINKNSVKTQNAYFLIALNININKIFVSNFFLAHIYFFMTIIAYLVSN